MKFIETILNRIQKIQISVDEIQRSEVHGYVSCHHNCYPFLYLFVKKVSFLVLLVSAYLSVSEG